MVGAARTAADVALVVVTVVLAVDVPVVQVVDVVAVDNGPVAAAGAVGVGVGLGRTVLKSCGHSVPPGIDAA